MFLLIYWLGLLLGLSSSKMHHTKNIDLPVSDTDSLQVITVNKQFADALAVANLEKIAGFYAPDAVAMPEYHSRISGDNIKVYFRQWLAATTGNQLIKQPYRVITAADYVLETGYFTHSFNRKANTPFSYKGKYIQVWRRDLSGKLKLVSQIWGATNWFDKKELPSIQDIKEDSGIREKVTRTDPDMHRYFQEENRKIAGFVKQRAGHLFAAHYTQDAIYMPYYSPMIMGRDSINSYYIKHEDPAVGIDTVSICIARLIPADGFYILDGIYSVNWRSGNNSGLVHGKSINIWRKEPDGQILLHWQMTNHDF